MPLAFVAGHTTRIRLGVSVLNIPFFSPALMAKQLATLDAVCGGRLDVGLGIGWMREEYAAVGVPYRRRGRRWSGPGGSPTGGRPAAARTFTASGRPSGSCGRPPPRPTPTRPSTAPKPPWTPWPPDPAAPHQASLAADAAAGFVGELAQPAEIGVAAQAEAGGGAVLE